LLQNLKNDLFNIRIKSEGQSINTLEINTMYSILISEIISIIDSLLTLHDDPSVKMYLAIMKYQELASREIVSLDDVFLSGKINKENFSDYLFKYAARNNSIKIINNKIQHENVLKKFQNTINEINNINIDYYSNFVISKMDKILIMSEIKSIIGYGSLFNTFGQENQNTKIKDKDKFLNELLRLESLIIKYQLLKPINQDENALLNSVLKTVYFFNNKVSSTSALNEVEYLLKEDMLLLNTLSKSDGSIKGLEYSDWHKKALELETLNNKMYEYIGNQVLSKISKDVSNLGANNKTQLALFVLLLLVCILFIYIINKNILEKIQYFETKFNDFLKFIKGESSQIIREQIIGNDEFSLMLLKMDRDIKFVEHKVNDEKNFIRNASVKLGNIKNGKFLESLNYSGDNILIYELSSVIDNFSHSLEEIVLHINTAFLELSSGNFKHRMKLSCQGEFLSMKNSLNITLDKVETLTQDQNLQISNAVSEIQKKDQLLAQQSKLAAMGEMVGSIAHQWRQPLNALAGNIQMVLYDWEDNIIDEKYSRVFVQDNMKLINYMSKTIDDFRDFFRIDKTKKEFNLKDTINSVINLIDAQLKDNEINISMKISDDCILLGFESEFQQVVLNILSNSKDEFLKNKTRQANIHIEIRKENTFIIISISDNAGGIPNELLHRVFEPYFTSKEQGKGTGLGLYMSKMIIEDNMNGKIIAYNDNDGAVFDIRFEVA
ncbi:MAG: HAMP domain-containing histidine kinase, partial [Campylobacteraceae bacterium]|nr:HAMP domain-containing histidine kinase [Campylobacteraceae bacterium]